ncbi:MAG TPA: DUF5947 family protein [Thermoanaerobaculia bacterium]|jgi:hypothetical protein|nr:DUF5947 family protein [Thermoanaerobaculia bacterium]
MTALTALRQFARKREPLERCDLCAAPIADPHRHLFDPEQRQLVCACGPCTILFSNEAAKRFRVVPPEVRSLSEFPLSDADWNALMIPINIAFFVRTSAGGRIRAFYPSPAGATESELAVESLDVDLQPDVQALLVNRLRTPARAFIVPIDECFRLVGLMRTKWRGLSGGKDVWSAIDAFFAGLEPRP